MHHRRSEPDTLTNLPHLSQTSYRSQSRNGGWRERTTMSGTGFQAAAREGVHERTMIPAAHNTTQSTPCTILLHSDDVGIEDETHDSSGFGADDCIDVMPRATQTCAGTEPTGPSVLTPLREKLSCIEPACCRKLSARNTTSNHSYYTNPINTSRPTFMASEAAECTDVIDDAAAATTFLRRSSNTCDEQSLPECEPYDSLCCLRYTSAMCSPDGTTEHDIQTLRSVCATCELSPFRTWDERGAGADTNSVNVSDDMVCSALRVPTHCASVSGDIDDVCSVLTLSEPCKETTRTTANASAVATPHVLAYHVPLSQCPSITPPPFTLFVSRRDRSACMSSSAHSRLTRKTPKQQRKHQQQQQRPLQGNHEPLSSAAPTVCRALSEWRPTQSLLHFRCAYSSLQGYRSHQEDSVLLSPCFTKTWATVEDVRRGVSCAGRLHSTSAQSEESEKEKTEDAAEAAEDDGTNCTQSLACFGVFDGHNGDEVSVLAARWFLDHLQLALAQQSDDAVGKENNSCSSSSSSSSSKDNNRYTNNQNGVTSPALPVNAVRPQVTRHTRTGRGDDNVSACALNKALVQALLHLDLTMHRRLAGGDNTCLSGSTACVAVCYAPRADATSHCGAITPTQRRATGLAQASTTQRQSRSTSLLHRYSGRDVVTRSDAHGNNVGGECRPAEMGSLASSCTTAGRVVADQTTTWGRDACLNVRGATPARGAHNEMCTMVLADVDECRYANADGASSAHEQDESDNDGDWCGSAADGGCHRDVEGVDYVHVSIANMGDSRAVVGRLNPAELILATRDHRLCGYPAERERVEACGGMIELDCIDGVLDVTRGLGDFRMKQTDPSLWWRSGCGAAGAEPIGAHSTRERRTLPHVSRSEVASTTHCAHTCGASRELAQRYTVTHETTKEPDCDDSARVDSNGVHLCLDTAECCDGEASLQRLCSRHDITTMHESDATRSNSDCAGNVMSNIADVYQCKLYPGEFLLLATDGVWARMTSAEAVSFIAEYVNSHTDSSCLSHCTTAAAKDVHLPGLPSSCSADRSTQTRYDNLGSAPDAMIRCAGQARVLAPSQRRTPCFNGLQNTYETLTGERHTTHCCTMTGYGLPHANRGAFCTEKDEALALSSGRCTPTGVCGSGPAPQGVLQRAVHALTHHVLHTLHGQDNITAVIVECCTSWQCV